MKLGLCIEMAFAGLPFEQRLAAAAKAGFRYVEMWFVDGSFRGRGEELAAMAKRHRLKITNTVIGSPDGSIGGGLTDSRNRRAWLARAQSTLEFCREAGIGAAIVCTGNVAKGLSLQRQRRNVLEGLKATVELAEKLKVNLWLEPLNDKIDHPGYFLTSSDEGAALCREVGSRRLKLLFDCYHMQVMEGDLCGHIRRNLDVIGHFHSAGHPGRHELWLGETNYPVVLREIASSRYAGVFAFEYQPSLPPARSLQRTLDYLKGV